MVACAGRQSCSLMKRIAMDNLFKIFKCWSHEIVSQPKTSQNRTFLVYTHVDESALVCAGILFSKANTSLLGFHRSHALFLLNCLFAEEQLMKLSFSTNRILISPTEKSWTMGKCLWQPQFAGDVDVTTIQHTKTHALHRSQLQHHLIQCFIFHDFGRLMLQRCKHHSSESFGCWPQGQPVTKCQRLEASMFVGSSYQVNFT